MADPRTIQVPIGTPGQTAEYELPPGVLQYIQSVVATVDTSSSGDVTPVLTISEQSGVVVADKQQANPITGGGSGRSTWALGLVDETGTATGFIRYVFNNLGAWLRIFTSGSNPSAYAVAGETANWSIGIDGDVTAVGGDSQLWLVSNGGTITAQSLGGVILIDSSSTGDTTLNCRILAITAAEGWNATIGSDGVSFDSAGGYFFKADNFGFEFDGDPIGFKITSLGSNLTVKDSSGNPIFRVDESGDLHGKTGKTLTFDL